MSAMVERVARAMESCGTPSFTCTWEDCARAAIEAMRKPTPKMLAAAAASMSPEKRPTPERVSVKAKHGIRYRAMIDAALKD